MKTLKIAPIFLLVILSLHSFAAIDPRYKEMSQRGYLHVEGDSVEFPDGSRCLLDAFNAGICGKEWMTDDYCVPQGKTVWDSHRCCEGLEAYLPEGIMGQSTCEPIKKQNDSTLSWIMNFFIGIFITLALFASVAFYLKNKR